MARRWAEPLFAVVVGVVSGVYIFDAPLKAEITRAKAAAAAAGQATKAPHSDPTTTPALERKK